MRGQQSTLLERSGRTRRIPDLRFRAFRSYARAQVAEQNQYIPKCCTGLMRPEIIRAHVISTNIVIGITRLDAEKPAAVCTTHKELRPAFAAPIYPIVGAR